MAGLRELVGESAKPKFCAWHLPADPPIGRLAQQDIGEKSTSSFLTDKIKVYFDNNIFQYENFGSFLLKFSFG